MYSDCLWVEVFHVHVFVIYRYFDVCIKCMQEGAEGCVHLHLALKHLQSVQTIDAQLEGTANLDLFAKLQAQVIHVWHSIT